MNSDDGQLSFEHLISDLMDVDDSAQRRIKHALVHGIYTINPKRIAHQWLQHSFQQEQETCLSD
jgi:hypothetical protein